MPVEEPALPDMVELLRLEQQECWRRGDRVIVEAYFARHPKLRADETSVLHLVYNEVLLREAEGERPQLEEYVRRFPQLAGKLSPLFEVHRAIESDQLLGVVADQPPPARDVPKEWPAQLAATIGDSVTERPGTVIGPYKLLQQIGEGGMGTVFMAEQAYPVQREVALKITKPGMDSRQVIARFEAERQALALMDHPNIAKVLDAGTTEGGRPYFVMELVKGVPITRYCDEHHLTPRERLELFVPVCQAIQHAHHKGIIHRDIKPSNVLVCLYDGKPVPKVIDFGVAKATGPKLTDRTLYTEFGAIVGTFEYMSPEQAQLDQLDIDTRSDIYSLGVLLYELLTGTTPLERKRLKEASVLELLRLVREQEAPRPSTRLSTAEGLPSIAANRSTEPAKLTRLMRGELDWILLKALEKDRNRRYETANSFAADVLHYLHDERVLACPPSTWYRLRKLARRNRKALWTASATALGLAAMFAGALVHNHQLKETRAASRATALVQGLSSADITALPGIIEELSKYRRWAGPQLAKVVEEKGDDSKEQLRARLALVSEDPSQVEPLSRIVLNASPQELLIIRAALLPYRAQIQERLWQVATDAEARPDRRLRAACALASFDPDSARWKRTARQVAAQLAAENPINLRLWLEGFSPIRLALVEPLSQISRGADSPVERSMAVSMLTEYAADRPDVLAELVKEADAGQYGKLFPVLQAHRERAALLMQEELKKEMPVADRVTERDALARRQAQAAVVLLHLGQAEPAWQMLRHDLDPSRRTYLLHGLGRLGTQVETILRRLETEPEVSARRALILSLGEFNGAQLPANQRRLLIPRLLQWYRDDPDPGIHSAIDWLLRHSRQGSAARKIDWQGKDALEQIDRERTSQPSGRRRWYVTREGHTLAVVRDPPMFLMGSPVYEPDREAESELPHLKRIPRSFAIATKEVTVAQFQRFLEANPEVKRRHSYFKHYSPDDDGPIVSVTWFEAAQYCIWLSKQEGLPESQWCYPAVESIKEGMDLPKDYLHRTGYRLPTESEWEYSCRAGALTSRFYGSSEEMLKEYAWYTKTTNDKRAWPVGQLKPNDLGLFDMYGNAAEWCQERKLPYRTGNKGQVSQDLESNVSVTDDTRVLRGCGFGFISSLARSASRDWFRPSTRNSQVGLRVARTYR
jgi:serine/threonine protein kinase/formylglycine-generating enzyme required for sulfatase activity